MAWAKPFTIVTLVEPGILMRHIALLAMLLTGVAALSPTVASAEQKILLENNFDAENNGQTALNYDLPGFSSGYPGSSIDLVFTGDYGITCAGGSGGCLDLDGTTGVSGLLFSNADFSFKPGDVFRLSYSVSGSQRASSASDGYAVTFNFNQLTSYVGRVTNSLGYDQTISVEDDPFGFGAGTGGIAFDRPFVDVVVTFAPSTAGSFYLALDGYSGRSGDQDNDNEGVIFDNLRLTQAVPEPASWGMMILGFGTMGLAMRRRVKVRTGVRFA